MQKDYIYHKLHKQSIPERLRGIDSPPKKLYITGVDIGLLLEKPAVSIVGSRKPTAYCREVTAQLARSLAQKGVSIISGLWHSELTA